MEKKFHTILLLFLAQANSFGCFEYFQSFFGSTNRDSREVIPAQAVSSETTKVQSETEIEASILPQPLISVRCVSLSGQVVGPIQVRPTDDISELVEVCRQALNAPKFRLVQLVHETVNLDPIRCLADQIHNIGNAIQLNIVVRYYAFDDVLRAELKNNFNGIKFVMKDGSTFEICGTNIPMHKGLNSTIFYPQLYYAVFIKYNTHEVGYYEYNTDESRQQHEKHLMHLLQHNTLNEGDVVHFDQQGRGEHPLGMINLLGHSLRQLEFQMQIESELFDLVSQVKQRIEGFLKEDPNYQSALQIYYALIRSESFYNLIHGI